jgi:NAD(P)-dependent dehydrogenase (short-subunit alcohol dehydrogenase family)
MNLGLCGKMAVVAGGSRGCGRGISEVLAAEGAFFDCATQAGSPGPQPRRDQGRLDDKLGGGARRHPDSGCPRPTARVVALGELDAALPGKRC